MQAKSRYDLILSMVQKHKPRTIVEVGTWNGFRAMEMLRAARSVRPSVNYIGYDLFEDASPETDTAEYNVKAHSSLESVKKALGDFTRSLKHVGVSLIQGNTRQTLHGKNPLEGLKKPILAFIDGGHSVETIRGDFEALKSADVVIMDDYYSKDEAGRGPDTTKFGCNKVVEELELDGIVAGGDPVKDGGKVALFIYPPDKFTGPVQLRVKTKNCVAENRIRANISYSVNLIDKWIQPCDAHEGVAVFCSGGPSLKGLIEDIRKESLDPNNFIICVKHAHDKLIEAGIIPFACVLLDPRPHVQDFIENPHPQVKYVTASMVHPSTVDRLVDSKVSVLGYNALVGAGEESILPPKSLLINGGTTSAIRGISVFHCLGFRKFKLYAYDSSYTTKQNVKIKTKTGAQKYYEVTYGNKNFWSDAELVAQVQDYEKLLDSAPNLDIEVFGEGLLQHVHAMKRQPPPKSFGREFATEYGRQQ